LTALRIEMSFDWQTCAGNLGRSLVALTAVHLAEHLGARHLTPNVSRSRFAKIDLILHHRLNVLHIVVEHRHRNDADECGDRAERDAEEGNGTKTVGLAMFRDEAFVHLFVVGHD